MKKILLSLSFVFMLSLINAQSLRVASYNLRYDNPGDSLDQWKNRYTYVADLIQLYDFDIFGTQEGLKHQLEDLKKNLPGYNYIGIGRDDGIDKGEHSAIFYKTNTFKLVDKGNFWLSPVTDKPNKGWDAACIRICSWGRFEEIASGKTFYFFNVHYDHKGETAQKESSKLIVEMIKKIAGNADVILTGDFNVDEHHEAYNYIKASGAFRDAYDLAPVRFAPGGTFTGFKLTAKPVGRIDHIFLSKGFNVARYGILTNTYNSRFPSDHFPVFAEVMLQ
jgi:endonuclease/exonuclease/phosphatase family metal-dependent hydrolase